MKEYKVLQCYYGDEVQTIISVPDDTVFIYKDGSVGGVLYNGANHYLAICNKGLKTKFGDLSLQVFNNIKPIDELPIISGEEAYERFDLGSYYIKTYAKGEFVDETHYPSVLSSVSKIVDIQGPYNVSVFSVHIHSWIASTDNNVKEITLNENCGIDRIIANSSYTITEIDKESENIFNQCKDLVLSYANHSRKENAGLS